MNPGSARSGQTTHVTVAVADGVDQSTVLDAAVLVEVSSQPSGRQLLSSPATTEKSTNKLFYETDFVLPAAGPVVVTILVRGAAGEGEASYRVEVQRAQNVNWLRGALIAVGVVAAVLIWRLWRQSRPVGMDSRSAQRARLRRRPAERGEMPRHDR
jgi:hypothetical protein